MSNSEKQAPADDPAIETGNVVTLRIPAAWYSVLMTELNFAASVMGRLGGHSPQNCQAIYQMLMEQGGAKVLVKE